jgi:hypothetical protein
LLHFVSYLFEKNGAGMNLSIFLALVNISKDLMRTVFDDEILSDSIFLMFTDFDNASAEDNLAIDASVAALYSVDNFAR